MVKKNKNKKALEPGQYRKGPDMDGFSTIVESPALFVKEENIAPFTMPIEAFSFQPPEESIVCRFKNGDQERKIYCNIKLQDKEQEQQRVLQEEAKKQGIYLLPSIAIMAGRFLSRARGDANKAINLMQATQEWRLDYFSAGVSETSQTGPVMDSQVAEDFKNGIVYFAGRDSCLRPVIVCRASRIPSAWYKEKSVDRLIKMLIFCMEYMIRYMMVPGVIENNCLLVDLKGLGISQVPFTALSQIYSVMSHHYIGRVYKFYICNMSSTLRTITGMVTSLLTDRQRQKLVIIDNVKDLQKEFALHQLEEDLGGSRPPLKEFFPFPMQAGPFTAGCTTGPDPKAVPGGHVVLSVAGARGRLYDTSKSEQENAEMDFSSEAVEFFERNNLPVPAACQKQHEISEEMTRMKSQKSMQSTGSIRNASQISVPGEAMIHQLPHADMQQAVFDEVAGGGEEEDTEEEVIIQDTAVKPKGWLCCRCSH